MSERNTNGKAEKTMISYSKGNDGMPDEGMEFVWAGHEDDGLSQEDTARCLEAERRGLLSDHEIMDGIHVWRVGAGAKEFLAQSASGRATAAKLGPEGIAKRAKAGAAARWAKDGIVISANGGDMARQHTHVTEMSAALKFAETWMADSAYSMISIRRNSTHRLLHQWERINGAWIKTL